MTARSLALVTDSRILTIVVRDAKRSMAPPRIHTGIVTRAMSEAAAAMAAVAVVAAAVVAAAAVVVAVTESMTGPMMP